MRFRKKSVILFQSKQIEEVKKTEHNLDCRGTGRCEPDFKQCGIFGSAHEKCHRDTDEKRAENALKHDKKCFSVSVKVSDKAKEEAGQQCVDCVSLQIICGLKDDFRVSGKYRGQEIPVKKCKICHDKSCQEGSCDSAQQGFSCALRFSCSDILGYKGRHGLGVGGGDKHDKSTELFSDTYSGRVYHAHRVHDSHDDQEGNADQKILQRNGASEFDDISDITPLKTDV